MNRAAYGSLIDLVQRFAESGEECALAVATRDKREANSRAGTLRGTVKRCGVADSVRVSARGAQVFLIRINPVPAPELVAP